MIARYFVLMMFLCEAAMSFNRASVIFLGLQYNDVWASKMKWLFIFIALPPLAITWNMCFQNVTIDTVNDANPNMIINIHERNPEVIGWMNSVVCITVICVAGSIWNLSTMTWNFWFQTVTIDYKNPGHPEDGIDIRARSSDNFSWKGTAIPLIVGSMDIVIWSLVWNLYTFLTILKRKKLNTSSLGVDYRMLRRFLFVFYLFLMQIAMLTLIALMRVTKLMEDQFLFYYIFVDVVHLAVPWMFLITQKDVQLSVGNVLIRMFRRKTNVISHAPVVIMLN
uniref:Serpentine receptor class gamma n=1 Tax=Panagrellus redivivus TaxID=6233 RepID=A0A7E4V8H1_PANRE